SISSLVQPTKKKKTGMAKNFIFKDLIINLKIGCSYTIKVVFLQNKLGLFKFNLNNKKSNMIKVTENAKNQAIRLMSEEGKDGFFIRVGVEGGGCSGLMYQLKFDNEETETDKIFE